MFSIFTIIGVPDGGEGGATAPPRRNSTSLGGKALMSEEEPEMGILMSLSHTTTKKKYIKQMKFRTTIVNKERRLGGTKKDFLFNLS